MSSCWGFRVLLCRAGCPCLPISDSPPTILLPPRHCVFDLCAARTLTEQEELRCQVLSGYAIICQEAGATPAGWRDRTRCGEAPTFPSSWSLAVLAISVPCSALSPHFCPLELPAVLLHPSLHSPHPSPPDPASLSAPPRKLHPTHPCHPSRSFSLLFAANARLCFSTSLARFNVRQKDTQSQPTLPASWPLPSSGFCQMTLFPAPASSPTFPISVGLAPAWPPFHYDFPISLGVSSQYHLSELYDTLPSLLCQPGSP